MQSFAQIGVISTSDNIAAVIEADFIIITVKPFKIISILEEIAPVLNPGQLIISVVSGVSIDRIKAQLNGKNIPVCRAMSNTAIAINESMTCIAAPGTTDDQKMAIGELFSGLGKSIFINEEMMDASTVLAACGITFAMRFIRAMMQGGIEICFDSKTARFIANQSVKGAAELLNRNERHPEEKKRQSNHPKRLYHFRIE